MELMHADEAREIYKKKQIEMVKTQWEGLVKEISDSIKLGSDSISCRLLHKENEEKLLALGYLISKTGDIFTIRWG